MIVDKVEQNWRSSRQSHLGPKASYGQLAKMVSIIPPIQYL
jgi:hypothetical protein